MLHCCIVAFVFTAATNWMVFMGPQMGSVLRTCPDGMGSPFNSGFKEGSRWAERNAAAQNGGDVSAPFSWRQQGRAKRPRSHRRQRGAAHHAPQRRQAPPPSVHAPAIQAAKAAPLAPEAARLSPMQRRLSQAEQMRAMRARAHATIAHAELGNATALRRDIERTLSSVVPSGARAREEAERLGTTNSSIARVYSAEPKLLARALAADSNRRHRSSRSLIPRRDLDAISSSSSAPSSLDGAGWRRDPLSPSHHGATLHTRPVGAGTRATAKHFADELKTGGGSNGGGGHQNSSLHARRRAEIYALNAVMMRVEERRVLLAQLSREEGLAVSAQRTLQQQKQQQQQQNGEQNGERNTPMPCSSGDALRSPLSVGAGQGLAHRDGEKSRGAYDPMGILSSPDLTYRRLS